MFRTDEAPEQTEQDNAADHIAGKSMQGEGFGFAADMGGREGKDQRSVEQPYQRIPHRHGINRRRSHGIPFGRVLRS